MSIRNLLLLCLLSGLIASPADAYTPTRTTSSHSSSTGLATGMAVGMMIGSSSNRRSQGLMVGECPDPDRAIVLTCYAKELGIKGVWAYKGCEDGLIQSVFDKVAAPLADGLHWEVRAVFDTSKSGWVVTGCGVPDEVKEK